jgi:hypothetical protein
MKRNQTVRLMRPGFTGIAVNHRVSICLWAVLSLVVCALALHSPNLARADDALPAKEPVAQTAPVQTPLYNPQGRQMARYKAFARQAEMPAITVTNNTTLQVGDTLKTDLNRLAQLSIQEKEALAGQFGVPAGVIGKVAERAANNEPPNAAQVAQDIRTAVVDYRFLQGEWDRYNPPLEGQKVKTDAIAALQAGDISRAWELYDGLQRPAAPPAPSNLRVVAQ